MSYEDFDSYYLDDKGAHLEEDGTRIDATQLSENEEAWIRDDKGANWIGTSDDFLHAATFHESSNSSDGFISLWMIGSYPEGPTEHQWASEHCLFLMIQGDQKLWLREINGGTIRGSVSGADGNWANGSTCYAEIELDRTAGDLELRHYSDEARTSLVESINLTLYGTARAYRYFFGGVSILSYQSRWSTGWVDNVDLAYTPTGGGGSTWRRRFRMARRLATTGIHAGGLLLPLVL